MATATKPSRMTTAEFLAWEEQQDERYEFLDGEIVPREGTITAMTGATVQHVWIAGNVIAALRERLRARGCAVMFSDLKVETPSGDAMYPDVLVLCPAPERYSTVAHSPVLIVEILSKSTAGNDYGRKRLAYGTIPALKHYVIVAQDRPLIEVFSRGPDESWINTRHRDPAERLQLDGIDIEIPIAEIYDQVTFDEPQPSASDR